MVIILDNPVFLVSDRRYHPLRLPFSDTVSTPHTTQLISYLLTPIFRFYLYKLMKLLFVVWMIHPRYQGALFIYFVYVDHHYKRNEEFIRKEAGKLLKKVPYVVHYCLNKTLTFVSEWGATNTTHGRSRATSEEILLLKEANKFASADQLANKLQLRLN